MTTDDDRLLQEIVCGDADEHAPSVRARLDADPNLRERLAELRAAQIDLRALEPDLENLQREARRFAAPDDRDRVAAAFAPRRRPVVGARRLMVIALAAAAVLVLVLQRFDRAPQPGDGRLGDVVTVSARSDEGRWRVEVRESLPAGASYHLRLEPATGAALEATADAPAWDFPATWNQVLATVPSARLVVTWDDANGLAVRHVVQLK